MKAVIFLNGEPPSSALIQNITADLVICADGAFNYLENYTTMIDIVVGDFDSFIQPDKVLNERGCKIVKYPADKDQTDSELAVNEALARGADSVDLYGATGLRDDHTLANLGLLLKLEAAGIPARIISDYNIIRAVRGPRMFSTNSLRGQTISIVPFGGDAHINITSGLKYKISDRTLSPASTLGISNEATEETFSVCVESGCVLIITVNP